MKLNKNTKMLVEGALMVALTVLLDFLVLYRLPDGGSISLKLIPIVFFAVRYGCGWGALVGVVFGVLNYIIGNGIAINWMSIIFDYFLSFGLLGFGAGLFRKVKWGAVWGTLAGGAGMFLSSFYVGAVVWGATVSVEEPASVLGMALTNKWLYSLVYNVSWAVPCILLAVIVFALLYAIKPVAKLLNGEDLKKAE